MDELVDAAVVVDVFDVAVVVVVVVVDVAADVVAATHILMA